MKKIISFVVFAALTSASYSQSLGYQNIATMFSRNDENGSARFVAMGGAFGAIGGDVSSMTINPAGISIFNGNNAAIAFQIRNTEIATTYYNNILTTQEDFFNISNAGAVLTFENNIDNDWSKFAFGVNFRVTADFENRFDAKGNSVQMQGKGRHDPCVVPRAVPIVEAMAALVLVDYYLLNKVIKH